MFYDVETRSFFAQERTEVLLRAHAGAGLRDRRFRRWLSRRLIAAGVRLAPECSPRPEPVAAG